MIKDLQRQLQQTTAGGVSTTSGTAATAPSGSSELGQVMGKLNSLEANQTLKLKEVESVQQTSKLNDIDGKLAALAYTTQNQPRVDARSRACSVLCMLFVITCSMF